MATYSLRAFRVLDSSVGADRYNLATVQVVASDDFRFGLPGTGGQTGLHAVSGELFGLRVGGQAFGPGPMPAASLLTATNADGVASTFLVLSRPVGSTVTDRIYIQIGGPAAPEFKSLWAMNKWFADQTVTTGAPPQAPDAAPQSLASLPSLRATIQSDIITLRPDRDGGPISTGAGNDRVTGNDRANHIDLGIGDDRADGGAGNDTLLGGAGADKLKGGGGFDMLDGGLGRDFLDGGFGDDLLTGGGGGDRFVFRGASGTDSILDFQDDIDVLDLRGYGLNASTITGRMIQLDEDVRIELAAGAVVIVENMTIAALMDDMLL